MSTPEGPDPDDLVIRAALGEPLDEDERQRLAEDPALQAEVAEFAEIVSLASGPRADDEPDLDHLWSGIAAEAFGDDATARARTAYDGPAGTVAAPRRRSRWPMVAAVGATVAAAVTVVVVATVAPPEGAVPLAEATLQPLGDADVGHVAGRFVVVDGSPRLVLDLSGLPDAADGFHEVWLLDPDEGRMVSLGPARPDDTYVLPDGVGVDDYPAVDVSVEPHDGDPAHSGDSLLRGSVTT